MESVAQDMKARDERRRDEEKTQELAWARARRDLILMRHPTNWAAKGIMRVLRYATIRNLQWVSIS